MATLAIGILLGLGVLLAWLRTRPEAGTAGPKRLAVLPFENLGRPEDEYFADGVTDEVRGKLAALPGLEVIARTSSSQYKETAKSPRQIGRELGVDTCSPGPSGGRRTQGGQSRVRVSPELVQVSTASTKWQAALRGAAHRRVPGAGRHRRPGGRGARRGARRQREREHLARATDAEPGGLRRLPAGRGGRAAGDHASTPPRSAGRAAITTSRRWPSTPSFALAWAQLSRARLAVLLQRATPAAAASGPPGRRARAGARARAARGPPGAGRLLRSRAADHARALAEYSARAALAPRDAELLAAAAGRARPRRGARRRLAAPASRRPRSTPAQSHTAHYAAHALLSIRRYPEALRRP